MWNWSGENMLTRGASGPSPVPGHLTLGGYWAGILAAWGCLGLASIVPPSSRLELLSGALVVAGVASWRAGLGLGVPGALLGIVILDQISWTPEDDWLSFLLACVYAGLSASIVILLAALARARRYAEQDLQRTLLSLEQRVQDRTEALSAANRELQSQVQGRQKAEGERARLETELRQAHKLEAIGRLAGGVAHDFNNLLMVIQGYGDLLLARTPPDHPDYADLLEVTKAAERGGRLTRQLLAFGRKQMLRITPLDLNGVVGETSQMLRRLIGEHIHLDVQLAGHACAIEADRAQLEQVLVNLAVNARDAMAQGGTLTIEVGAIEVSATEANTADGAAAEPALLPGRYVRLRLRDTGCGMDEATRARLFEPFFTTKAVGKGSGLGLATVYGIVKQLGGEIDVQSVPLEGATFTIHFPETSKSIPVVDLPAVEPLAAGTETVLLVEDDEPVRELVRAVLQRHGYRILEASGPRQALALAAAWQGEIDIVLADVVMPEMTGPEMVARLQALRRSPAVLYISGYATDALAGEGVLVDGLELVQKPVAARDLLEAVRRVLAARAAAPAAESAPLMLAS